MAASRSEPKTAELVRLYNEKGDRSHMAVLCYRPGFKEAYGIIHTGDTGPVLISVFGDDSLNRRRLRRAFKDWEKDGSGRPPVEWSFRWAVGSFLRWLNSGGERRVALARTRGRAW